MKNINKLAALAALALLTLTVAGLAGCGGNSGQTQSGAQPAKAKQYTCAMHPEVVLDKPGKCPKCGMDLVEKN